MGWNAAYTIFEKNVIGFYDTGKLDKETLILLMEPYIGTDIDSGGSRDLKSKDGKSMEEIVIEMFGKKLPPYPDTDENYAQQDWQELKWELFFEITREIGWR